MEENHYQGQVPEPLTEWTTSELQAALSLLTLNVPNSLLITFCKKLSQSDVDDGQDRLLIPRREAREHILPFLNANENAGNGIPIKLYDTDDRMYPLCFLQRKDGKYFITHREPEGKHWRDVRQAIGLKRGSSIKFWTLRRADQTTQLSFVIEKI